MKTVIQEPELGMPAMTVHSTENTNEETKETKSVFNKNKTEDIESRDRETKPDIEHKTD